MAALVVLLLMVLFCGTMRSQSCDGNDVYSNVVLSGFYWEEVNGEWVRNGLGYRGGEPVYVKTVYGSPCYLWKLTWNGRDAWATGYALDGSDGYWEWRWGANLVDPGSERWEYWTGSQWAYHQTEPTVTCTARSSAYPGHGGGGYSGNPDSGASDAAISQPAGSGNVWNATMLEGARSGPPLRDGASSAVDPPLFQQGVIPEIAAGVAVCVLALVAVVIVVFIRRKRKKDPQPDAADHIPEKSPTDIAVQIEMGTETAGSVESVTAEDSQSVS